MRGGAERARDLRQRSTDAERKLWHALRSRQIDGCKFRRQHPIGPYFADFACLERNLIVEADGGQHADNLDYDAQRTAFLESEGFRVLRFWDHDILQQTKAVLAAIHRALTAQTLR